MAPLPCLYFSLGTSLLPRQLKQDGFFCRSLHLTQSKGSILLQEITPHCLLVSDFWLGDLATYPLGPNSEQSPNIECKEQSGEGGTGTKRGREEWRKAPLCPWCPSCWSPRQFSASRRRRLCQDLEGICVPTIIPEKSESWPPRHPACVLNVTSLSRAWWYLPLTPTPARLRLENCEFKASLNCIARTCLKY